jgi:hypothetical protein
MQKVVEHFSHCTPVLLNLVIFVLYCDAHCHCLVLTNNHKYSGHFARTSLGPIHIVPFSGVNVIFHTMS